ncbi:hypothetical protein CAAN1_04S06744 [[Candida] anglica]|uniref:C2H2-type domain-containing protein n=1 Tax=[Candida] anglica TaxID=148631 RepID=A0ABP0EA97_9ASCO
MGKSAVQPRGSASSTPASSVNNAVSGSASPKTTSSSNMGDIPKRSEPRRFDQNISGSQLDKDDDKLGELGNSIAGNNGQHSNSQRRKSSVNSNFLFNPARQDSISSLLNSYSTTANVPKTSSSTSGEYGTNPAGGIYLNNSGSSTSSSQLPKSQSIDSNFPSFYMGHKDSGSSQTESRPRGDSVFLPPPITPTVRTGNDEQLSRQQISSRQLQEQQPPQQQQQPPQQPQQHQPSLNSRSNSIFSALIQLPASNGNSFSGQSGGPSKSSSLSNNAVSTGGNLLSRSRLPSVGGPGAGADFQFTAQEFENFLNKESLGGSISWQQATDPKAQGSKSKRGSVDANFWEGLGNHTESIVGLPISSGSISSILAGITNGNIQFSGMNNEQRRDSILKLINEQQLLQQQQQPMSTQPKQSSKMDQSTSKKDFEGSTRLREDIFDKNAGGSGIAEGKRLRESNDQGLTIGGPVSPSSMNSRSAGTKGNYSKDDESHSPKTSPSGFQVKMRKGNPNERQQQVQQNMGVPPQSGVFLPTRQPNNYPGTVFPQQVPSHGYQIQQSSNPLVNPNVPNPNDTSNTGVMNENKNQMLAPVQSFMKSEDDRPLLGATKIDQLMLVIQARDKGVKTAIPQGMDGSVLANPETVLQESQDQDSVGVVPRPIGLVGGIPHKKGGVNDKEQGDSNSSRDEHQCPYCFKYFTQQTHLEVHVRSHIGYKPFECEYCHKRFTQGGNLRTHLRLHTGEKPFTCEICGRSFSRKGNLAAHKLTHDNLKPFACKLDDCDKAFTQLGNLKSHQNRFHQETLNDMTHKFAALTGAQINNLPPQERDMMNYFKDLYKNSNKGIRGRGKGSKHANDSQQDGSSISPPNLGVNVGNNGMPPLYNGRLDM